MGQLYAPNLAPRLTHDRGNTGLVESTSGDGWSAQRLSQVAVTSAIADGCAGCHSGRGCVPWHYCFTVGSHFEHRVGLKGGKFVATSIIHIVSGGRKVRHGYSNTMRNQPNHYFSTTQLTTNHNIERSRQTVDPPVNVNKTAFYLQQ